MFNIEYKKKHETKNYHFFWQNIFYLVRLYQHKTMIF